MDSFNPKNPLFWSKSVVQLVALYNGMYHKNVDANSAIAVVGAVEIAYHAAHGLGAALHAFLHKQPAQVTPNAV